MGDTLIFVGDSLNNEDRIPTFCRSHDNGITFSPWQPLDVQFWDANYATVSASAGRIFAFSIGGCDGLILRSLDGGVIWTVSRQRIPNIQPWRGIASGSQVICIQQHCMGENTIFTEAAISNDSGETWNTPILISDDPNVWEELFCVTQTHLIISAYQHINDVRFLATAALDRLNPEYTNYQTLSGHPQGFSNICGIAGDTAGETAILLTLQRGTQNLFVSRTTDGGATWEASRALTDWGPIYVDDASPDIFCHGKLWGVFWENYWDEDTTRWGAYMSFSANHGKDWYPPKYMGFDFPCMGYSSGQFIGNEIRAYLQDNCGGATPPRDYKTVTGLLTPDTVSPDIFLMMLPHDTIRVGDTLQFVADVTDNDTLSYTRLVIADSTDQITKISLIPTGFHVYQGSYVVPYAGRFRYRGEAEDFWENTAVYPDTGWLEFHTEGWSAVLNPFILPPSSFILSVSPNPFNSSTQISFTLPVTSRVSLRLYDVLGREVKLLMDETQTAGEHRVSFDGSNLSSGIYFCRMQAGDYSQTQKIVLIR